MRRRAHPTKGAGGAGYGAAEAGADDEDVVAFRSCAPSFFISRRLAVITLAYVSSDIPRTGANRHQPLRRDRLRLGVAEDALAALTAAHAGLAHAAHRGVDAGEGRGERLVDVDGAALDLPGDRAGARGVPAVDRGVQAVLARRWRARSRRPRRGSGRARSTGPKVSLPKQVISGVTPSRMVGS